MIEKVEQTASRGSNHIPTRLGPELSSSERAEQLWGLFNEYSTMRRGLYREGLRARKGERSLKEVNEAEKTDVLARVSQNPLAARLEGEIANLWGNPGVRGVFVARVKESLRERQQHGSSTREYRKLRHSAKELEEEYFDLMRNQFLMRQMTPTLRAMDISRNRLEKSQIEAQFDNLEETGGMPVKLKEQRGGLDREHADLAALLAYERVVDYHRQYKENGVIFTPSRDELLDEVLLKTSQGTWTQLIGETGTGKTTFAKRTSWILNGEPPQYAAGERWGDVGTLIGSKTFDRTEQGDRTYFDFGPLTVALTGCQNSLEMEEAIRTGREPSGKLLILDELNKFDQDALFGALKIAATLRPGEFFNFKELPGVRLKMAKKGVAIISTMNPATARYERKELDPALDRLFYDGKKRVDYPPMTSQKPELYEIFLGILMDDNGRIRIPKDELAPHFVEVEDVAARIVKQELDSDVSHHGALYRFALAATEIHKSFSQKESVARTANDPGLLEKTVLEMEVLVNWMDGYSTQIEGGMSLPAYLEHKLNEFYSNIDNQNDRVIFERVFRHFGFDIASPRDIPKVPYNALTPVEMGYLTPRAPRAVRREGEELIPRSRIYIDSETGEEINYLPVEMETDGESVAAGTILEWEDGTKYRYLGKREDTGGFLVIPVGPQDIEPHFEAPSPKDNMVERAKEILGKDFLGLEAVRKMEAALKGVGANVEFRLDRLPDFPYSEQDLQLAKQNGEMVVLRASHANIDGRTAPLSLISFRELFKKDPVGGIPALFYSFRSDANDWYLQENFATNSLEMELGWAIVKKEFLNGSTSKNWQQQEEVMKKYGEDLRAKGGTNTQVRRRTAKEAVWDTMLYYSNTKEQLLETKYDWTSSRASGDRLVGVGGFDSGGLYVGRWDPANQNPDIGVCPSR